MSEQSVFDPVRFIEVSECLEFESSEKEALPTTESFLAVFDEIMLLFDVFGKAFYFVKSDLSSKMEIVRELYNANGFKNLEDMVNHEKEEGSLRNGKSGSRHLLRLMWGMLFIRILLNELSDDDITLYDATCKAYADAIRPHHPWSIRQIVNAALYLCPTREYFLEKVSIDLSRKDEFLERIESSMGVCIDRMYAFYDKHGLHDLP
eukprot:CAMPEP_0174258044 /NCGR_PEP_ID=MMETSP0439-20130205/7113_1 /TAXON_ID=0 /ORGANISM="Stereomyxa ramosa, Strain Chinc5" /LENGTH=205 /DNA_ID=CAMNT_0015341397 /DNA_START=59 /DNA_END=676 /DNA_ORIENTATION=-